MTDVETVDTETRNSSFEVLGRTIPVKPLSVLSQGQQLGFLKLFRRYSIQQLDAMGTAKLDQALSKLLAAEDNEWLDFQIMEDKLEWQEVLAHLLGCLRGKDDEPTRPEPVKKAPRARKAAVKKAPAKKAVKRA
jgi:hypothetical protein